MYNKIRLNDEDRYIFIKVNDAISVNPFSDERIQIDNKIINNTNNLNWDDVLTKVLKKIEKKLLKLKEQKKCDINLYYKKDKDIFQNTLLFFIFHKYIKEFDLLIVNQLKKGDESIKVNFYNDIKNSFLEFGFREEEVIKYFSIFFQLRRAFYFIENLLIGESKPMKKLRMNLWENIFSKNLRLYLDYLWNGMEDFSTLILGDTGSGKGNAATAIGCSGYIPFDNLNLKFKESFTKAFVEINLSQYSLNLIESELFGYKKGAFTGAIESHKGIFSQCSPYGAIFLDEIGEVSIPIQIKLLKILQERIFSPVGSHQKIKFQGRIIAATNRSISQLRVDKKFRDDFYYRLSSDIIEIPNLKVRIKNNPKELDELIKHLLKTNFKINDYKYYRLVKDCLKNNLNDDYAWPGNVRELEQAIRRILLKEHYTGDDKITSLNIGKNNFYTNFKKGNLTVNQLISEYCKQLYSKYKSYEKVAKITDLDRRTVKKYIL